MTSLDRPDRLASRPRRLLGRAALALAALALSGAALAQSTATAPIRVVAAENFYGDVAKQLGGAHVAVTSILSNPDQDPHLFEASPKTARDLHNAALVVYNGADYDPWMDKLLAASKNDKRVVIVAADLVGKKAGDNPHLWYDPRTMPAVAQKIVDELDRADAAHKAEYDANLAKFLGTLKPVDDKIEALKAKYQGVPVTATEPVAGYLCDAIGLTMKNARFQLSVMNDTEPAASDIAAFEQDLRGKRVRVFIYNAQAVTKLTERMLGLAKQSGVPSVSVTETEPAGKNYQQWMSTQVDALAQALGKP
ncbi:metal ABC transporter solute-binding protein [Trinickia dinghuensis]|uniref:Cation ABC transporter substrate-binding protein n=1 Tax=Trinickia dinghuensis TaxID=2291023 RepID=A0A3D8K2L0_9BURK|nr:metal ABC transporter solute-binding protein [Trinickia dinghuensis]RDU99673.1 cation ABC transporter substrate-binding protein [Trinickia dinghuensis]